MDIKEEKKSVEIFCCYARKDQQLLTELKNHLKLWERQQLVTIWADTDIRAGTSWQKEITHHLNSAQIILLLVSPDFLASEYCYSTEMTRAMERHKHGEVCVIPIILRPCIWEEAPFGKIQALPTDAEPVVSPKWHNLDEAFIDVAKSVRQVVDALARSSAQNVQQQKRLPSRRTMITGITGLLGIAVTAGSFLWFKTTPLQHSPATPQATITTAYAYITSPPFTVNFVE